LRAKLGLGLGGEGIRVEGITGEGTGERGEGKGEKGQG